MFCILCMLKLNPKNKKEKEKKSRYIMVEWSIFIQKNRCHFVPKICKYIRKVIEMSFYLYEICNMPFHM